MDKEKRIVIYMNNGHAYIVKVLNDCFYARLHIALVKDSKHFNIDHYDACAITHCYGHNADRVSEVNINLDNVIGIDFYGWDTK